MPINVAQLHVRYHLVFVLLSLLALILEPLENFIRHFKIFKIHSDISKNFQSPVQTVKCLFFLL